MWRPPRDASGCLQSIADGKERYRLLVIHTWCVVGLVVNGCRIWVGEWFIAGFWSVKKVGSWLVSCCSSGLMTSGEGVSGSCLVMLDHANGSPTGPAMSESQWLKLISRDSDRQKRLMTGRWKMVTLWDGSSHHYQPSNYQPSNDPFWIIINDHHQPSSIIISFRICFTTTSLAPGPFIRCASSWRDGMGSRCHFGAQEAPGCRWWSGLHLPPAGHNTTQGWSASHDPSIWACFIDHGHYWWWLWTNNQHDSGDYPGWPLILVLNQLIINMITLVKHYPIIIWPLFNHAVHWCRPASAPTSELSSGAGEHHGFPIGEDDHQATNWLNPSLNHKPRMVLIRVEQSWRIRFPWWKWPAPNHSKPSFASVLAMAWAQLLLRRLAEVDDRQEEQAVATWSHREAQCAAW